MELLDVLTVVAALIPVAAILITLYVLRRASGARESDGPPPPLARPLRPTPRPRKGDRLAVSGNRMNRRAIPRRTVSTR